MVCGGLFVMALSLLCAARVDGFASAVLYAVVFGIHNAVNMTYFAFLWPRYFGRKHLGSIQGLGQMMGIIGASVGALPLALAVDAGMGYGPMLQGLAVFPVVLGLVGLALLRRPRAR